MITHEQFWQSLETIAHDHGMSISGLAVASGLASTTFNKSKRFDKKGRARWPNVKSIIKICDKLDIDLSEYFSRYLK